MEPIKNLMEVKKEMQVHTNYSKNLEPSIGQILDVRSKAPCFGNLPDNQRLSATKALLIKISVITGWILPEYELKNILAEQFEKLLLENYPHYNVLEIEYAFRRFGTEIKDWGKEVNLSLISEVLSTYQAPRSEAVRNALESPENSLKTKIYTDEEMDNEMRGQIQAFLDYKWQGKASPLWLPIWEEILVKDGFIKDSSQTEAFFQYCLSNNIKIIYKKNDI